MTEDGGRQHSQPKPGQVSAAASAAGGRPGGSLTQPLAGTAQQLQPHQHSAAAGGRHRRMSSATAASAARLPRAMTAHQRLNIRSMLATTFHREGLRGLYHGIGPTLVGIVPYAGLKFYVYQVGPISSHQIMSSVAHSLCCASQLSQCLHARQRRYVAS